MYITGIGSIEPKAEAKEQELRRVRDFEMASEDQQRHNRTATPSPRDKLEKLPLTRERFEG